MEYWPRLPVAAHPPARLFRSSREQSGTRSLSASLERSHSPVDANSHMPVLMIFVDGAGIGDDDPAVNPFARARAKHLVAASGVPDRLDLRGGALVVPTDATLGVDGLPQS